MAPWRQPAFVLKPPGHGCGPRALGLAFLSGLGLRPGKGTLTPFLNSGAIRWGEEISASSLSTKVWIHQIVLSPRKLRRKVSIIMGKQHIFKVSGGSNRKGSFHRLLSTEPIFVGSQSPTRSILWTPPSLSSAVYSIGAPPEGGAWGWAEHRDGRAGTALGALARKGAQFSEQHVR